MSETREKLLDDYLLPLLAKYFPLQPLLIERSSSTLDVFVVVADRRRRITYEQMRDRDSNKILDIVYKIANPHRYPQETPRETIDYLDGRLHGPKAGDLSLLTYEVFDGEKWIKTLTPLAERLDRAVLAYAQALALQVVGKGGNSCAEFNEYNACLKEIKELEEKCK